MSVITANNQREIGASKSSYKAWLVYLLLSYEAWMLVEPFIVQTYCPICSSLSTAGSLLPSFAIYSFVLLYYVFQRNVVQKIDVLVWIYVLFALFSSLINHSGLGSAISAVLLELKYIILFLLLAKIYFPKEQIFFFLKATVFLLILQSLLGFFQELGGQSVKMFFMQGFLANKEAYRVEVLLEQGVMGTLSNKNIFGTCILIGFTIVLFDKLNLFTKSLRRVLIILLLFALLLSIARTVWIAAVAIVLFTYRKSVFTYLLLLVFSAAIIVISMSGWGIDSKYSKGSLVGGVMEVTSSDYVDMVSELGRIAYLIATYEAIKSSPIFGLGGGNWGNPLAYEGADESDKPIELYGFHIPRGVLQDNNFASLAGQFGLLGLALFLMVILYYSVRFYRHRKIFFLYDRELAFLCTVCLGITFIMFFTALMSSPFSSKPISFMYWSILGICVSNINYNSMRYKKLLRKN